ncbi:hypothetical protein NCCP2222_04900 [Sporosarcina sp. NCCP-2222]|uniref:hypothetical protein n=1 Tax=Sporosarcina sp. NCCP-2222 TaxID=2935073 RepID=UPI002082F7EC|nr:hypothetical protein [Sporosarcina sp. NCCP-2222]GKV54543.1 hypothetical protein NCCP2222_04900 [Sporosarcina sp. NCCP-2222]
MGMYVAVFLRIMLFISTSLMVYDFLVIQQNFIKMERGFITEFSVYISPWPGYFFIGSALFFLIANIIQYIFVRRDKKSDIKAFMSFEYNVSDERAVVNTRKAVSIAFALLLVYSLLMIGSYLYIPNYFVDHIWFPLFTTASIPVFGLLVYLISYKILEYK